MTVKKILKIILCIFGALVILLLAAVGFFVYLLDYQVRTVDQAESPDGTYELLLQSVGSPLFFSSADGRLVLKQGKEKIAERDFTLYDDGGSVRADIWQVTWLQEFVRIRISGSEQNDEWIEITYDGKFFPSIRQGMGQRQKQRLVRSRRQRPEQRLPLSRRKSRRTVKKNQKERQSRRTAKKSQKERQSRHMVKEKQPNCLSSRKKERPIARKNWRRQQKSST